MTELTLHNYEAFLLDYSEGNLTAEETEALKIFLVQHPELPVSLDDLVFPVLSEDAEPVDFKPELKKTAENLQDELVLNYLEGNLLPEQKTDFEARLQQDAELAKDLAIYKKTIVTADLSFVYEAKTGLLKTEEAFVLNSRSIGYMEGQLSLADKVNFERELKTNAALQQELTQLVKTKLLVDTTVIYPHKEELKKSARIISLFSFRVAVTAAAAVLLLAGLVALFTVFYSKPAQLKQIAQKETAPQNTSIPTQQTAGVERKTNVAGESKAAAQVAAKLPASQNKLIGKKSGTAKKDTALIFQQPVASAVATVQQQKKQNPPAEENKKTSVADSGVEEKNKRQVAADSSLQQQNEAGLTHLDFLNTGEDPDEQPEMPAKKGFWKRAVQLAKRANQLGVKSVDGEEKSGHAYSLSFNSFSVEKK